MRDTLQALAALQRIDLEVASLRKTAEQYPKDIAELEKQLGAVRAAVEAERLKLEDLDRQRSTLEVTLSEDKDKVRKWEARLSEQRSTREYSALAREIDIARKGQATMSEELTELARAAAVQRELVKQKDAELGGKVSDLVARVEAAQAKLQALEQQIGAIETSRVPAASAVEPGLLRRYDNVRKKKLPALVAVKAPGTCGGCGMNLRPQLYHQLLTSRGIDVCPSCQRLIYAAEVLEAAVPASR